MIRPWRRVLDRRATERSPRLQPTVDSEPLRVLSYELLTERIVAARAAVRGDCREIRSWTERRADHQLLTTLLNDAVTQAFAADAVGATPPVGVTKWVTEGLARSTERELAMFAALDAR